MEPFNIRQLLAGIGILLFAMTTMESGLKKLATEKTKYYLEKYTHSAFSSILSGSITTGILQSSTLITLITIGFVGAGLMQLRNAIGVVIGANIGTTLDALYVSLLGFGEYAIDSFALPIIAIGGLLLFFGRNGRLRQRSKVIVGFGLFFVGISFMKESVQALQSVIDFSKYTDFSLFGFGLLGVVVTATIQSSSTTSILTFTALSTGLISFPASIAIIMGANIGTTILPFIVSLQGAVIKRQLALAHVLFNIASSIIGIIFFRQFIRLVNDMMNLAGQPVLANAIVNTIFNLLCALLAAPFIGHITKRVSQIRPDTAANQKPVHRSLRDRLLHKN